VLSYDLVNNVQEHPMCVGFFAPVANYRIVCDSKANWIPNFVITKVAVHRNLCEQLRTDGKIDMMLHT